MHREPFESSRLLPLVGPVRQAARAKLDANPKARAALPKIARAQRLTDVADATAFSLSPRQRAGVRGSSNFSKLHNRKLSQTTHPVSAFITSFACRSTHNRLHYDQ